MVYTGRPGRPTIIVDKVWLQDAISNSHNITLIRLANTLNISVWTLRTKIREYGLKREKYSNISDDALDEVLRNFKQQKPQSGRCYAIGHLQNSGYQIQRDCVEASLRQIDGLGQEMHCHEVVFHREYHVPRSNHLWHIDGHHNLIAWGIVIHSVIDGFCRSIYRRAFQRN